MVSLVGVVARLRSFLYTIFIVYLHLAFVTDHQRSLLLLVTNHMFSEEFGQFVLGTLEPRHAFLLKLFLNLEVRLHVVFFGLEGDVGLDDVDEAIDVFTLLYQHVDCL